MAARLPRHSAFFVREADLHLREAEAGVCHGGEEDRAEGRQERRQQRRQENGEDPAPHRPPLRW